MNNTKSYVTIKVCSICMFLCDTTVCEMERNEIEPNRINLVIKRIYSFSQSVRANEI